MVTVFRPNAAHIPQLNRIAHHQGAANKKGEAKISASPY